MPIYEFICQSCGNEFERIQSFSETRAPACPQCGGEDVVRRLGRPAIHFKGSGWYITDSKNGSRKGAAGENGDGGSNGKIASGERASSGESSGGEASVSREKTSETKSAE